MEGKKMWLYAIITLAVILLVYFMISGKQAASNSQNQGNANTAGNNAIAPSDQGNQANNSGNSTNSTKSNSTLVYALNWGKYSIDNPNKIISLFVSGSYNQINISSNTELYKITITGTSNNVTICNGQWPFPIISKTGANDRVTNVDC